jgi:hypothetical protein
MDVPLLTRVPMNAIQCLSPKALPPPSPCVSSPSPRSHILTFFLLGRVSPVRADSSISSDTEVINLISAGIRSPTENVTRSPGRRALARGARDWPLLMVSRGGCEIWQRTVSNDNNGEQATSSVNTHIEMKISYLIERFEGFLRPLFLYKRNYQSAIPRPPSKVDIPVKTIPTATKTQTASS